MKHRQLNFDEFNNYNYHTNVHYNVSLGTDWPILNNGTLITLLQFESIRYRISEQFKDELV